MMRALIDPPLLGRLLLGLGVAAIAGTPLAAAATGQASPYRLNIRLDDFKLHIPDKPPAPITTRSLGSGLAALIDRHAQMHGLDPALVHAVIRAESAYRPEAVSAKGAIGLMQVMPDTGRRFGETDLSDPEANLRAGTAYLSHLLTVFDDLALALAAYNAGEGAVIRHGYRIPPFPETQAYVQAILEDYTGKESATLRPRRSPIVGTRLEKGPDRSPYRQRRK